MVNNPILCPAIVILWLVALPGFVTICAVLRIVNIVSLVVPATVFPYFPIIGSHYNSSVGSVKYRLQNVKSQYENAYWKVLSTEILELVSTVLTC